MARERWRDGFENIVRPRLSITWLLGVVGVVACVVAFFLNGRDARAAASQDWSPFVLVTGLLLVGLVADDDGLFKAAGDRLARTSSSGVVLFLGATMLVGAVTAVLNLDTSVAFLTPVLVYAARSRGGGEAPLLYGCLLLSNAGSLFLPGSNLTNLIVLGHLRMTGANFISHMWAPGLVALFVTAGVVGVLEHRELRLRSVPPASPTPVVWGLGLLAIGVSALFVLVLAAPALEVLGVGTVAIVTRIMKGRDHVSHVAEVLGVPLLVGLFGIAVALGTLGRAWSYPGVTMSHLNVWATGAVSALASVVFNNLPAASLLSAHAPTHPFALLIGLNLGPNLFVSGSLAWLLWLRAARVAGAEPSIARASTLGLWAVPLSVTAALAALVFLG
ncbi:MAG: ArsB/NhaD family transporter [Acidimicrobiales bacterium]